MRVHGSYLAVLAWALCCAPSPGVAGDDGDPIAVVEAYRTALDAGDHDSARRLLAEDPRVWYGAREGEGEPLRLEGGRWRTWDDHFNSRGRVGPWTVEQRTVWTVVEETNDYFRLLEREDIPRYRLTYFLDEHDRIEGYSISAADPDRPKPPRRDRFDEFETWAKANHPDEWAYLRPGGELDPTGDRAPRTRRLLELWRAEVGLPPLE